MRENIKVKTLVDVINGKKPTNTIVGNRLVGNTFEVAFVATHRQTGAVLYNRSEDKVRLNWKESNRQDLRDEFEASLAS